MIHAENGAVLIFYEIEDGDIIELSVKQEKHSTRTLSLVIHRVRF
jgi:hypothetical protein